MTKDDRIKQLKKQIANIDLQFRAFKPSAFINVGGQKSRAERLVDWRGQLINELTGLLTSAEWLIYQQSHDAWVLQLNEAAKHEQG